MLTHAWLIPAIPALSFLIILFFGKRMPRGGSEIGIAAVAIAFVLALGVGVGWIQRVNHPPETAAAKTEQAAGGAHEAAGGEEEQQTPPVIRKVTWIDSQDGTTEDVTVGTMVDGLSAVLLLVVTIVSLLV